MDVHTLGSLKIIFLLGFTLHNLEEAVWLPKWSKLAEKYHPPVKPDEFFFAVLVVTVLGYILATLDFLYGQPGNIASYAFLGFIAMMGINAIFPHLISTIILKKYAPGLLTGMLLNLPISAIILYGYFKAGINLYYLLLAMILLSVTVLPSLKPLFRLGGKLINFSDP